MQAIITYVCDCCGGEILDRDEMLCPDCKPSKKPGPAQPSAATLAKHKAAREAARAIFSSHKWTSITLRGVELDAVQLDPAQVLGKLCGSEATWIMFATEERACPIRRVRLGKIRTALRQFSDVRCYLALGTSTAMLVFLWHGGRGGLILQADPDFNPRQSAAMVILPNQPTATVINFELERARKRGFENPHPNALRPGDPQSLRGKVER